MAKFENLTVSQLVAKETELQETGAKEAQGIVSVEAGRLEGQPVVIGAGKNKSISCFIITYKRNNETRYFKGAYFNAKHLSNSKSYNNLTVGLDNEAIETLQQPANQLKSYSLLAEKYTTSDGRKVTTVKMDE